MRWVGSSYHDLCALPARVKRSFGYALSQAQAGRKPDTAKPFKLGLDVIFEIVDDWSGNTYRAFYTVKIGKDIYVLHCFQKKSPRGSETPRPDVVLLQARLKAAKADAQRFASDPSRSDRTL